MSRRSVPARPLMRVHATLELTMPFALRPLRFVQMWTEVPSSKSKKPVNKDRFISKMFLRCAHAPPAFLDALRC